MATGLQLSELAGDPPTIYLLQNNETFAKPNWQDLLIFSRSILFFPSHNYQNLDSVLSACLSRRLRSLYHAWSILPLDQSSLMGCDKCSYTGPCSPECPTLALKLCGKPIEILNNSIEILNNSIFEPGFCKWGLIGQWGMNMSRDIPQVADVQAQAQGIAGSAKRWAVAWLPSTYALV